MPFEKDFNQLLNILRQIMLIWVILFRGIESVTQPIFKKKITMEIYIVDFHTTLE